MFHPNRATCCFFFFFNIYSKLSPSLLFLQASLLCRMFYLSASIILPVLTQRHSLLISHFEGNLYLVVFWQLFSKKFLHWHLSFLSFITLYSESCSVVPDSATPWTVHGILQARILEWVVFPFSRESSLPRDQTQVSCSASGFFTSWATREARLCNVCIFYVFC